MCNLLRADVGGDYAIEVLRQPRGRLSISGGTIPSAMVPVNEGSDVSKQFFRVIRAKLRVLSCLPSKITQGSAFKFCQEVLRMDGLGKDFKLVALGTRRFQQVGR